jgi:hypothetical protein
MNITLFGSCRISNIRGSNNLNKLINYTHSTKEVLQFILFLKGELEIPYPYNNSCFRTAICNNSYIHYVKEYTDIFNKTDVFIIEICSLKKYIHNNYYLHHLSVDKTRGWYHKTDSTILNDSIIDEQPDEEIENDILEIQKLLYPKKIIIVSHYNAKKNGKVLQSRNKLICLLEKICKKYNICFVNPTTILKSYNQSDVLNNDLGHYTTKGASLFTNYMNSIVNNLL